MRVNEPEGTLEQTGMFQLEINNHGGTPAELLEIGIGWCAGADPLPDYPDYRWFPFRDRIGPGTQSRPVLHVPIPDIPRPTIYARFTALSSPIPDRVCWMPEPIRCLLRSDQIVRREFRVVATAVKNVSEQK